MADHLPECPANWGVGDMPEGSCAFCEMLRACEQRIGNVISASLVGGYDWRHGYLAGLDAAREAVAALDIGRDVRFSVDVRADALAAIDGLRGES